MLRFGLINHIKEINREIVFVYSDEYALSYMTVVNASYYCRGQIFERAITIEAIKYLCTKKI